MEALLATQTIGEFLRLWLQKNAPELSLADVTERCGLRSKGFFHALLNNQRPMTLETFNKVSQGLKLNAHSKKHLRILCELQGAPSDHERKLRDALERNQARALKSLSSTRHTDIPALMGWDRVYAASGTLEEGATLTEICSRSRLPIEKVRPLIDLMIEKGILIRVDEERVLPVTLYGCFPASEGNQRIPNYLLETLDQVKQSCRTSLQQTGTSLQLYRNHTFSVNSERFPELRSRLRALLEEFASTSEDPKGDRVARAFLAFELLE